MEIAILFGQRSLGKVFARIIPVFILLEIPLIFLLIRSLLQQKISFVYFIPLIVLGIGFYIIVFLSRLGKISFVGGNVVFHVEKLFFSIASIPQTEVKTLDIHEEQSTSGKFRKIIHLTTTGGKIIDFAGKDEQETNRILSQLKQMVGRS